MSFAIPFKQMLRQNVRFLLHLAYIFHSFVSSSTVQYNSNYWTECSHNKYSIFIRTPQFFLSSILSSSILFLRLACFVILSAYSSKDIFPIHIYSSINILYKRILFSTPPVRNIVLFAFSFCFCYTHRRIIVKQNTQNEEGDQKKNRTGRHIESKHTYRVHNINVKWIEK